MRNSLDQGKYLMKNLKTNKEKFWDSDGNFEESILINLVK